MLQHKSLLHKAKGTKVEVPMIPTEMMPQHLAGGPQQLEDRVAGKTLGPRCDHTERRFLRGSSKQCSKDLLRRIWSKM